MFKTLCACSKVLPLLLYFFARSRAAARDYKQAQGLRLRHTYLVLALTP